MGVKTSLGWTIVGHVPGELGECRAANHAYTFYANYTPEVRADDLMRKMWDEDVMGISDRDKPLTPDEMLAARKTAETSCYTDGRNEVAIPWIDDEPPLCCNRKSAEDRPYSLKRHLKRRPDVAEKYCQVLEVNVTKGYIQKLEPGEVDDGPSWYLPLFLVVRKDKETIKVRMARNNP